MKRANGKEGNGEFLDRAVSLLKEYTEKLRRITREFKAIREKRALGAKENESLFLFERDSLGQLLNRLAPAGTKLAQVVSQQIEHAKLDELEKVELRLRLAEFENAIQTAQRSPQL